MIFCMAKDESSDIHSIVSKLPYEQLLDRVPEERKVKNARLGLTHNLGGAPWMNIAAISIVGLN